MLKPKFKKITLKDYSNKDINLLPQDIILKKKKRYRTFLTIFTAVLAIGLMSGYYFYLIHQIKITNNANQIKAKHIQELLQKEKQQELLGILQEKIDIKSQHLMNIEKASSSMPLIVSLLEDNLPKDIHFLNLSIGAGGEISISGLSNSEVSIGEFIYNLKESKAFNEVFVSNITYSKDTNANNLYSFNLLCKNRGQ